MLTFIPAKEEIFRFVVDWPQSAALFAAKSAERKVLDENEFFSNLRS
jgi:hypothetical protein